MVCAACGTQMNQHGEKVDYSAVGPMPVDPVFHGVVQEVHQCTGCGNVQLPKADVSQ
jgi:hypothetical protein